MSNSQLMKCSNCESILISGSSHMTFLLFHRDDQYSRITFCWNCLHVEHADLKLPEGLCCAICKEKIIEKQTYNYVADFIEINQRIIHLLCSEKCFKKQDECARELQRTGMI